MLKSGPPPSFIFRGVVTRARASLIKTLRAESCAIVRVEEVLSAPSLLSGYAGVEITLRALDAGAMREGASAVFFTAPTLFADTLVVDEREPAASLADPGLQARLDVATRRLRWRVSLAQLVVIGHVISLEPAPWMRGVLVSNDPEWTLARVKVERAWKADNVPETVIVLFPASKKRNWASAPKLAVDQVALLMLTRATAPTKEVVYTALDPADVQSEARQSLLKGTLNQ